MHNRQHLIYNDVSSSRTGWVAVSHASEEGGVVRKAIELAEQDDLVVIADDTDILILLVYHAHGSHQFYKEMN